MNDETIQTLPDIIPSFGSEAERQTAQRDEVSWKNKQEMLRLIAEFDLFIRKDAFDDWRPTTREFGEIPGVKEGLTIIATDGNLAYFTVEQDFDVFFGHIQMFTGEVRTLFSMPREGLIKEKKDRPKKHKTVVDRALELLHSLAPKT